MKLQIILPQTVLAQAHGRLDASPSLARLLGVGSRHFVAHSAEALLCQAAAVAKQSDWPIAAIANFDQAHTRHGYWLRVDFVHFVLQRDYFTLAEVLALSAQESEAVLSSLNQHFAGEGLQFGLGADGRCYLRLEHDPHISTTQPQQVLGLDTTHSMPQGPGAPKWNRLLNEMQMLLFEHPTNQLREQHGQLAANSVWLSGGGVLPAVQPSQLAMHIIGSSALCQGLQNIQQQSYLLASKDAHTILQANAGDSCLLLDHADLLQQAQTDWFQPLLHALRTRELRQLTLQFALGRRTLSVHVTCADAWKLWRSPRSLLALAPELAAGY